MTDKYYINADGLLLSDDNTLVEFADGCTDGGGIIPGAHEAGETVPCPECSGEHRITSALVIPTAHNITVTKAEPADDDEPGN